MHIETNNAAHFGDFISLNELRISEHFSIEEADRELAANPGKVVSDVGYIFSLLDGERVVGVCALFKESPQRYQLARMAVELAARGNGYGNRLIEHALAHIKALGASSIFLFSNTVLQSAIALYKIVWPRWIVAITRIPGHGDKKSVFYPPAKQSPA